MHKYFHISLWNILFFTVILVPEPKEIGKVPLGYKTQATSKILLLKILHEFPALERFTRYYTITGHHRSLSAVSTQSGLHFALLANDCGPLVAPRNGSLFGSKTTYPNKIIFSCDNGFILIGSSIRQCRASKTWDGVDTLCEGKRKKFNA